MKKRNLSSRLLAGIVALMVFSLLAPVSGMPALAQGQAPTQAEAAELAEEEPGRKAADLARAQANGGVSPDRVVIVYDNPLQPNPAVRARVRQQVVGGALVQADARLGRDVIRVPGANAEAVARGLRNVPGVLDAYADLVATIDLSVNDPHLADEWGLGKIQAPTAWDTSQGQKVNVAVLDCGVRVSHPDLAGNVVVERNFTAAATADDLCNHGTHVAGTIAAVTNNGVGVAGVAPGAKVLNGKVLDDSGSGFFSDIDRGIQWAAEAGAKVINMSLSADAACPSGTQAAIDYAWNKGAVIVAAAGNSGKSSAGAPANCRNAIAVAATNSRDAKASWSNYGSNVHVAAPGVSILSTVNPDVNGGAEYASFNGTSMASPHTAGVVALIWATSHGTSPAAVRDRLFNTADRISGTGKSWKYGRINAAKAVADGTASTLATNLALGKPASQSSTYEGAAAGRGVDGGTNGSWDGGTLAHTQANAQAWWQVDLGASQPIGSIDVWNRTDCCQSRLSSFNVLVSDDGQTWWSAHVAGSAGTPTTVQVGRTGRYVKVQLTDTDYLALAEVQVWEGSVATAATATPTASATSTATWTPTLTPTATATAAATVTATPTTAATNTPTPGAVAQGDQGLQGGWAVDDGGNVNFYHSLSSGLPLMRGAGAGWVRVNFRLGGCFSNWTSIGCNGQSALQAYEQIVASAAANNLKVLGLISNESWHGSQEEWTANNAEHGLGTGDNDYVRAFAQDAAGVLASHFKDQVHTWEVWNEPNAWWNTDGAGHFSGGSYLYPSNYAWLLQRSYSAIKAAQPGTTVLFGGLLAHEPFGVESTALVNGVPTRVVKRADMPGARRPTTPPGRQRGGVSASTSVTCSSNVPSGADSGASYLCATYAVGESHAQWAAGAYPVDGVAQHPYLALGDTANGSTLKAYLDDLRNAYAAYEGASSSKRLHVTEFGWPTDQVSNAVQAENVRIAYETFRSHSVVARAYWFNVQDVPEGGLYYGLTDTDGLAKPSLGAYQTYATYEAQPFNPPTATATPTATSTATASPTGTATPTSGPTQSPTATLEPTSTATATATPTATATATATPTATSTPVPMVPEAPGDLSGYAQGKFIRLAWSGSPTAGVTYNVYRGTTAGGGKMVIAAGVSVTGYDDKGVRGGQTYYYQVTAVNAVGESARSNEVSVRAR